MTLRKSELGHTARDMIMLEGAASGIRGPQQHQLRRVQADTQPQFGTMGLSQSSQDMQWMLPNVENSLSEVAFSTIFLSFLPVGEVIHTKANG